jgi:hypothetical protein
VSDQINESNVLVKMTSREIQASGWRSFAPTFTADYAGWLTTIGISGVDENGALNAIESRDLPLREVAMDLKDDQQTAIITVGYDDNLLTHEVRNVSRIAVIQIEEDQSVVLHFGNAGGQTTTLKVSPTETWD